MWRLRLRAAALSLLGLVLALVSLWVLDPQQAFPNTALAAPAGTITQFSAIVLSIPDPCQRGTWEVQNTSTRARVLLQVTDTTRLVGGQCSDFRVGETIRVIASLEATPAPGQPLTLVAQTLIRYTTPTPLPVNNLNFRGTLQYIRPGANGGQDYNFDTAVGGRLTVSVFPTTTIEPAGVMLTVGRQANVLAESRNGGAWVAKKLQVIQYTNEINFTGLIDFVPGGPNYMGEWVIGGRAVLVNAPNIVQGTPQLHRRATVKARQVSPAVSVLEAIEIIVDDTGNADSFNLKGKISYVPLRNIYTEAWRVSCVPVNVLPAVGLPDGYIGWPQLQGETFAFEGTRDLRGNKEFYSSKLTRLPTAYPDNRVELTAYVDRRMPGLVNGKVQLKMGPLTVDVDPALPGQDQATDGTIVYLVGTCGDLNQPRVSATSLEVKSKPFVSFDGPIAEVQTNPTTGQPTAFIIIPPDRDEPLTIRASAPVGGRYPAEPGYCLSGYGFLLQDASIDPLSLTANRCAIPPTVIPTVTPTPTVHLESFELPLPTVTPASTAAIPQPTLRAGGGLPSPGTPGQPVGREGPAALEGEAGH